ncbi:hypothetical protein [Streptomyces rimosus]|uniref:hypothetical protein n=1 Tax=Streptomyces rimosus TaxID=1927 RepID=UPI002D21DD8F|nr:hypothetical protein [Streptomyces rimosus]
MSSSTVRTARRRTLRIAAAALTAAAGLTLTACSGSDTGGSKAAAHLDTEAAAADTSSGAGASADGQESGGQAGTGAKAESGAKAKAEGKTGAPGAAGEKSARSGAGGGSKAGGSGGQRCHTSDLKAAFATGEDAVPDPNASGGTTTTQPRHGQGERRRLLEARNRRRHPAQRDHRADAEVALGSARPPGRRHPPRHLCEPDRLTGRY